MGRFFRRILGLERSGRSVDTPSFEVDENSVVWNCHVCDTRLRASLVRGRTIEVTCPECGTKRTLTDGCLDPPKGLFGRNKNLVFITRATLRKLKAKKKVESGGEAEIPIRDRLVYHEERSCAFAHKDYEVDGVLIAYNSGVIEAEYDRYLKLCKACAGVGFEPCDRCGGRGDIPKFRHVQNGICFKCRGDGYVEKYPDKAP